MNRKVAQPPAAYQAVIMARNGRIDDVISQKKREIFSHQASRDRIQAVRPSRKSGNNFNVYRSTDISQMAYSILEKAQFTQNNRVGKAGFVNLRPSVAIADMDSSAQSLLAGLAYLPQGVQQSIQSYGNQQKVNLQVVNRFKEQSSIYGNARVSSKLPLHIKQNNGQPNKFVTPPS